MSFISYRIIHTLKKLEPFFNIKFKGFGIFGYIMVLERVVCENEILQKIQFEQIVCNIIFFKITFAQKPLYLWINCRFRDV